jgi:RimJ/RimL family protein N-acetyltransferase
MIETARLKLIPAEIKHFEAFMQSEAQLAELLEVSVADGWLVFPEAMSYSRKYLEQNADAENWWMYFFILKNERKLIGSGGFKGKPDETGMVEIGYAIAPICEMKGLATEAAQGLIEFAFSHAEVDSIQAHTLAEENASNSVLKKTGMRFVKNLYDDDDGDIWQWKVTREDFQKLKVQNDE